MRDVQGNSLAVYDNTGNTNNWREEQLYGSRRLGMWKPNLNLATANGSSIWDSYRLKFFELSNHLGKVMEVVSDNRLQTGSTYEPDVINSNDYYAFGGQMNGRDFTNPGAQAYRYGFNGKENDNEVKGAGNQQDYGMRIYDPRIGKFLSVDPITSQYPSLTPYQFSSNSPIANIDLDGLEAKLAIYGKGAPLSYEGAPAGTTTAYTRSDVLSFKERATKMAGFNSVSVNNGQMIISALKNATKTEG